MVIPSGWYTGTIDVKADSVAFLNDSVKTRYSTYVLPFRITNRGEIDSLVKGKDYNVVGTMYENMLFGNYWHGGAAVVNRAANPNPFQRADTVITYYTTIPVPDGVIWIFFILPARGLMIVRLTLSSADFVNASGVSDTTVLISVESTLTTRGKWMLPLHNCPP